MDYKNIDINLKATLAGHQNPIFALAVSADSKSLYSGGNDKGVVEWDLESNSFKRILCKVGSSVYCLLVIPGTDLLAIGMRSGQILVVDTQTLTLKANLKVEQGAVFSMQIIPGKNELIAIGEEGYAYVYQLDSFELLYRFKIADTTVRVIAVHPTEDKIAFGDKFGEVHAHSASDFHQIAKEKIHDMPVTSLLFHQDALFTGGRDAKLYKLRGSDLSLMKEVTPHMFTVYGISNNPDYPWIATASRDKTWKLWNPEDLTLVKNISRDRGFDSHQLSINTIVWDQQYLFTAGDDKVIKIWELILD